MLLELEYRGYMIDEDCRYTNGTSDWQVYPKDEQGYLFPRKTLEQVKEAIDEIILEKELN